MSRVSNLKKGENFEKKKGGCKEVFQYYSEVPGCAKIELSRNPLYFRKGVKMGEHTGVKI